MNAAQPESDAACPLCGTTPTIEVVRQNQVPAHQNALYDGRLAARSAARGTLDLRLCPNCEFVFNAAFDPALLDYGPNYDNTQTYSAAFSEHLDNLIELLVEDRGIRNRRVVEVGCGKGDFLRRLLQRACGSTTGCGYDPSYLGPDEDLQGRLRFCKTFYGSGTTQRADVVVCRHVIEHVPRPLELLRAIRAALHDASRPQVYFETPCVEWILHHRVVWDLFYEHCSLFTARSLAWAFAASNFVPQDVRHVFGSQYLWLEATTGIGKPLPSAIGRLERLAADFAKQRQRQLEIWQDLLYRLHCRGPVVVWGAGAKGVTFCNLTDPDQRWLQAIVDINPAKQNKYIAGTGHPILAPGQLTREDNATVLVLNPNYFAEVVQHLKVLNLNACVLDLMNTRKAAA